MLHIGASEMRDDVGHCLVGSGFVVPLMDGVGEDACFGKGLCWSRVLDTFQSLGILHL